MTHEFDTQPPVWVVGKKPSLKARCRCGQVLSAPSEVALQQRLRNHAREMER